jgi:DNA-directed RNA polymerase specialized sigma24 family protein
MRCCHRLSRRGMNDVSTGARGYALDDERARIDQRFEDLVRWIDSAFISSASAYAYRLLNGNADDVDEAMSATWEKVLISFDLRRSAKLKPFFFTVLHHTCCDIIRDRKRFALLPDDAMLSGETDVGGLFPDPADEVIERIGDLRDRIATAIATPDLTAKERAMLSLLLEDEETDFPGLPDDLPVGRKAGEVARKQKSRLRSRLDDLVGLTPDEVRVASLIRVHHTVPAAAKAAPGLDVTGLFASARRKYLAFFGFETKSED